MAKKDKDFILVDGEAEVVDNSLAIVLLVKLRYHKPAILSVLTQSWHLKLTLPDEFFLSVLQLNIIQVDLRDVSLYEWV